MWYKILKYVSLDKCGYTNVQVLSKNSGIDNIMYLR